VCVCVCGCVCVDVCGGVCVDVCVDVSTDVCVWRYVSVVCKCVGVNWCLYLNH